MNVELVELFDDKNPTTWGINRVKKVTTKYVTILLNSGEIQRFHRATGKQVGFHWPTQILAISKKSLDGLDGLTIC